MRKMQQKNVHTEPKKILAHQMVKNNTVLQLNDLKDLPPPFNFLFVSLNDNNNVFNNFVIIIMPALQT